MVDRANRGAWLSRGQTPQSRVLLAMTFGLVACGTTSSSPPVSDSGRPDVTAPTEDVVSGSDARAPADTTSPDRKKILMVVGDSNETVARGDGIGDRFVRDRLANMLGHQVTLIDDIAPAEDLLAAAQASDMVLVVESILSGNLGDHLKTMTTPLLNYEAFIQDEMGQTPAGPPGDPGEPTEFALGVRASDTAIDIVDPNHPLAAGLRGKVTVYRDAKEVTWGKVAPTAEVVATLTGASDGATIYVYREGATLYDGSTAAGLRVQFFIEDDNVTGTPNLMTDDGLKLFDAAVSFTLKRGR